MPNSLPETGQRSTHANRRPGIDPAQHPAGRGSPFGKALLLPLQSSSDLLLCALALALLAGNLSAAPQAAHPTTLSNEEIQSMVRRVLQTEMQQAQAPTQGSDHPMQYRLHKTSPRLSTTKLIVETKDGDVARLVAVNDLPLSPASQQAENVRLDTLLNDPSLQRHRQQREQGDADRVRKVIRALPDAFLYQFAGIVQTPQGACYRLIFHPKPGFDPEDLEAQMLKAMAGELWIDIAQQRVTRIEGKRLKDVDFGWGILGKLDQGGSLLLQQADVGNHQWRTSRMVLVMNARILFKVVKLDTALEMTDFAPVAPDLNYKQAIHILNQR